MLCEPGYFPKIDPASNFDQTCKPCHEDCLTCVGSPTNCSSCASQKVMKFNSETKEVRFVMLIILVLLSRRCFIK
jgi:hypothetical protein